MKVSVIIPIYNAETYLAECLESATGQTLNDIEIICVNDCATDRSGRIIKEYADRDKRIRIVTNKNNRGLSYSRNRGLKAAEGKYVCFLDADDLLVHTALEELYHTAEEQGTDIVIFDAKMRIESGRVSARNTAFCAKADYPEVMSGVDYFRKAQEINDLRVPVWLQFWNRTSLDEMQLEFLSGILHEDLLFTYLALMQAKRVLCVRNIYYIYRRHEDSITLRGVDERYLISILEIYQQIMEYWHKHLGRGIDDVTKRYLLVMRETLNKFITELSMSDDEIIQVLGRDSIYAQLYRMLTYSETGIKEMVRLAKSPKVYIYGAGQIAKRRVSFLQKYDISIDGILVTDPEDNPTYFMDIPVYGVNHILDQKDDCVVVIGVGKKLRREVIENLSNLNITNIVEIY